MHVVRYALKPSETAALRDAALGGLESTVESRGVTPGERGHRLRMDQRLARSVEGLAAAVAAVVRGTSKVLIVEGVDPDVDADSFLPLVGTLAGHIREYEGHGASIVEVTDRRLPTGDRPTSDNNRSFGLHTDMSFYPTPPALVLFLMLRPARQGGASTFCDPAPLLRSLTAPTLDALMRPFRFPAPPHRPDAADLRRPILAREPGGAFTVRFRRDGLVCEDAAQEEALDVWQTMIDGSAIEIALEAGQLAVFSNRHVLHGRRAFVDAGPEAGRRRALRAYADMGPL